MILPYAYSVKRRVDVILLLLLLAGILAVLAQVGVEVRRLRRALETQTEATDKLRLDSRARVRTMSVRSGPATEERMLRRLGRATRGKRVVVGGEIDSLLHTSLSRRSGES